MTDKAKADEAKKQPELTKEYIRKMVSTDNRWARNAILALYQRQTDEEQMADQTVEDNGVGFSGVDAEFLSSLAKQLLAGKFLTEKQYTVAKKRLGKYSRQLLAIAQAKKAAAEAAKAEAK